MTAISPDEYRQQALDLAQEAFSSGGTLRLGVISDSMAPLLLPGDGILVGPVLEGELRRGDLVVVRRGGELLTHRVVGRTRGRWLTKGDNRRALDPPVPGAELLGRVVAIERQSVRTDLESGRWRRVNGWIGRISWWEAWIYRIGRRIAGGPAAGAGIAKLFARPAAALRRQLYRAAGLR